MSTTVPTRTCENASAAPLTVDRLLSAPLPELLAEVGAEIVDVPVDEHSFLGEAVQPRTGLTRFYMPSGRTAAERDTVIRILVGKVLGAPMRPVPASLEVNTYGGAK
ncbi:hypothetical protein ACFWV1_12980 [Streptomyces sp. NPDC058700]|uniref:hypothetical protein n=1 Tax=Streptomyces sp. NPDC058700 TaxID=3346607 RepID=UPI00366992F0